MRGHWYKGRPKFTLGTDESGANRLVFMRGARQVVLRRQYIRKQEARHTAGYAQQPQTRDEVAEWLDEQVWDES